MTDDTLFSHIEQQQADLSWGRVLDSGTGVHSLRWISSLQTESWTAVTATDDRARSLRKRFRSSRREQDRVLIGNWTDDHFLTGEVFDVVIADYLLGAIDGFTPYFQDRLFQRLAPHVGRRLYVVGLDPYPKHTVEPAGRTILELARARDACYLLSWGRPYREYPMEWVVRHLEQADFEVLDATRFPNILGQKFIRRQADAARSCLSNFPNRQLEKAMRDHLDTVQARALDAAEPGGIRFGHDYVVTAAVPHPLGAKLLQSK